MTEPIIRYKFLNGRKSSNGDITWRKNRWQKHGGDIGICQAGFHCSRHIQDALGFVQGDTLAVVEVRGKSIIQDNKECWQEMRVLKFIPFNKEHAVKMAIFSARLCLHIYEDEYPGDKRPRQAIEAAEKYLADLSDENGAASEAASVAASVAASEAASAASEAASAASVAASRAASRAASAASVAASVAASAASAASWAASVAASRAASWAASEAASRAASRAASWAASVAASAASKNQIHDYMVELTGAKL